MKVLKVVVDTNVFVSAAIKSHGAEATLLNLVADRQLRLWVSDTILNEYRTVLRRPRLKLKTARAENLLRLGVNEGVLAIATVRLSVSPDESDNRFLECAEAAEADYLVTDNKRHFPDRWKGTRIVNARELLDILGVAAAL